MAQVYGVISDLHDVDYRLMPQVFDFLIRRGVDSFVFNGDLVGERFSSGPAEYLFGLLQYAGLTRLPTYVVPGSHEDLKIFTDVMDFICNEYDNIHDASRLERAEAKDHHLIFVPGSEPRIKNGSNSGFEIREDVDSGVYSLNGKNVNVFNPRDLFSLVADPEKTVVFSHMPPRFGSVESGVDMAEFYVALEDFTSNGEKYPQGYIFYKSKGKDLLEAGCPVEFHVENRGLELLRGVYQDLGLRKVVSGHFHESVHRAHDINCFPIPEGLPADSLFFNASCFCRCQNKYLAGIVRVNGLLVSYERVDLREIFS